jgi:hypothetical protein
MLLCGDGGKIKKNASNARRIGRAGLLSYTRKQGVWTHIGNKLAGVDISGGAGLGYSVALSRDGTTVLLGGPYDNSGTGAGWVFVQQ